MSRRESGRLRGKPRTRRAKTGEQEAVSQQTLQQGFPAVAVSRDALARLRRQDLLVLAQREGLKGRSRLKKKGLIQALEALLKRRAPQTEAPPPPSSPDWENAPLPEAYGDDRLVLMPIDPYWVHAYWEMRPQSLPQPLSGTDQESGEARGILRVYDVTFIDFDGTNAHSSFDIEITPRARNWYINLWNPGKTLCAELGLLHRDGTFSPLARSNMIQTSRAWTSRDREEQWLRVEGKGGFLIPGQGVSSHGAVGPAPRVGPPPSFSSRSRAALERSSPARFQPGPQERPPEPGIESAESLLHPKEAVQAEEYRCFLESARRMRIVGRDDTTLPMLKPPPVQHAGGLPEIGLSSLEFVMKG